MRKTLGMMLSIATLLVSATLFAHGGLVHTMGTVTVVDAKHIEVKTQDGATVSIQLTGDTKYLKGKAPAKASDVAVGMRVMVESKKDKEQLVAAEVRLGTGKPAEDPRH
jgi:hypothetical protein